VIYAVRLTMQRDELMKMAQFDRLEVEAEKIVNYHHLYLTTVAGGGSHKGSISKYSTCRYGCFRISSRSPDRSTLPWSYREILR
jgi:hypothetical protein